jgi:hypothetical protein
MAVYLKDEAVLGGCFNSVSFGALPISQLIDE